MKIKKGVLFALFFGIFHTHVNSQNNALVLNGAYVVMNGGTSGTPIYLVVNQSNVAGISRLAGGGHIISEGQYNIVSWNTAATGTYTVPFGSNSASLKYLPLTFKKNSGSAEYNNFSTWASAADNTPLAGVSDAGTVAAVSSTASVWGGSPTISVIDRWWDLYAPSATNADVTFTYRGEENTLTGAPTGQLGAQHWNGAAWDAVVASNPAANGVQTAGSTNSVTVPALTTFSPWILVTYNTPLPVELVDASAVCDKKSVRIEFSTLSESNCSYFVVEKSLNGSDFYTLQKVWGSGNSSTVKKYYATDEAPSKDINYYRIIEYDQDGSANHLKTIVSRMACDEEEHLPNQITRAFYGMDNQVNIEFFSSDDQPGDIMLYDATSRLIASSPVSLNKGLQSKSIAPGELAKGTYVITVQTNKGIYSKKIIVSK